jgi:fructuronate reductase
MSLLRLSPLTLAALPSGVAFPTYNRDQLATGIVHLGIGAFHRAHQAVYTDEVLAAGDARWGILGVSLRQPDTYDALNPQGCLYTVSVRDADLERLKVIGSVRDVLVAPDDPARLITVLTEPSVKIVSLTVTEKGYCHDPATGALREDHPDIRHDLAAPGAPRTAIGYLVAALGERRRRRLPPFTVLCCDNLPNNGATVKRVLQRFAFLRDPDLGRFLADELACPSTMVDRIVPATTNEDRARIDARLGLNDAWPIVTEPFTQWVIEDHFPQGRPSWDAHGAQFTDDVAPFEVMKLRLLNGAHSCLAYIGYLCGYQTVAESLADPAMLAFIRALMDGEVTPTLRPPPGFDIDGYKRALIARFANSALKHKTAQIAMDGSQKLPQRWLASVRDRLSAEKPFPCLALGLAAWMRYVTGSDEQGRVIDVRDPLAHDLRARALSAGLVADRLAEALLGVEAIFGRDLPRNPRFTEPVTQALDRLIRLGAHASVVHCVDSLPGT